MAHIPVQCQNCGARYKIPETFKSDSAKCKGCGTMIDVKSARGADAGPGEDAKSAATAKPTGGTRKPRQAASARGGKSSRRRGGDDDGANETKAKGGSTARSSGRRGRRGADDDEAEEGGRGRYEKKKDNMPLITVVSLGALAVVAAVFFFANPFGGEGDVDPAGKKDSAAVASKDGDGSKADTANADPDAAKASTEVDAEKAAATKKVADAAAKKKAAAAKKKALDAAAKKEITKPEHVFKPAGEFKKFDRPEAVTEAEEKTVNELLDDLKAGAGLGYIKAPARLAAMGWKILPLVVNRMLEIDYSDAKGSEYSYVLANRILLAMGRWEFGFVQSRMADSFDLKDGHQNALRMRDVHQVTRVFWTTPAGWDKYKAKYPEKFN